MTGSKRDEGAAALVGQNADARHADQQTANGNKQGSEPKGAISLPLKQPPANSEAAIGNQKTQTEQPSQYDLRDLAAQEDMAFWAMWMFVAALATFAITSLGTLLIWRQVKLTRQAVEDTSEATRQMSRQNDLAEVGQRPWLSVEIVSLGPVVREPDGKCHVSFNIQVKNTGLSPAIHVVDQILPHLGGEGCVADFISDTRKFVPLIGRALAPGAMDTYGASKCYLEITDLEKNGLVGGLMPRLVLGVAYNDVRSSEPRYTVLDIHVGKVFMEAGPQIRNIEGRTIMRTYMA